MSALSACELRELDDQLRLLCHLAIQRFRKQANFILIEPVLRLPDAPGGDWLPLVVEEHVARVRVESGLAGKERAKEVISGRNTKGNGSLRFVLLDFVGQLSYPSS